MQSSRVIPHTRTGARTSRSGASARTPTSKRTWSLPLPGAAVGHRVGAELAGGDHEVLGDDRPRQRRHQRVLALVERVGPQRGEEVLVGELGPQVDDLGLDRTGRERPLADGLEVARPDRRRPRGRHLGAPLVGDPLHRHRGVETAGVREHHSLRHGSSSCFGSWSGGSSGSQAGEGGQLGRRPRPRRPARSRPG